MLTTSNLKNELSCALCEEPKEDIFHFDNHSCPQGCHHYVCHACTNRLVREALDTKHFSKQANCSANLDRETNKSVLTGQFQWYPTEIPYDRKKYQHSFTFPYYEERKGALDV